MKVENFILDWVSKKYHGSKDIEDWSADEVIQLLKDFSTTELGKAFDAGFNISDERCNAEFRDQYEIWDDHEFIAYDKLRTEFLKTYNL